MVQPGKMEPIEAKEIQYELNRANEANGPIRVKRSKTGPNGQNGANRGKPGQTGPNGITQGLSPNNAKWGLTGPNGV